MFAIEEMFGNLKTMTENMAILRFQKVATWSNYRKSPPSQTCKSLSIQIRIRVIDILILLPSTQNGVYFPRRKFVFVRGGLSWRSLRCMCWSWRRCGGFLVLRGLRSWGWGFVGILVSWCGHISRKWRLIWMCLRVEIRGPWFCGWYGTFDVY